MVSSLPVLLRNSRIRWTFILVIVSVFVFSVYYLHNKHSQFQSLNEIHNKCLQMKDTLAAQLQVAHEHRIRLEKFLEKEKVSIKETKEALELQNVELQRNCQRDKKEIQFKLSEVMKSHEDVQAQLTASQAELKQAEWKHGDEIAQLKADKDSEISKMQVQLDEIISLREHQDKELAQLTFKSKKTEDELEQCQYQLKQPPAETHPNSKTINAPQEENPIKEDRNDNIVGQPPIPPQSHDNNPPSLHEKPIPAPAHAPSSKKNEDKLNKNDNSDPVLPLPNKEIQGSKDKPVLAREEVVRDEPKNSHQIQAPKKGVAMAKDEEGDYRDAPEDDVEGEDQDDGGHGAMPDGKPPPFHDFEDNQVDTFHKQDQRGEGVLAPPR